MNKKQNKTVVVGMSGGVDSSVSALLLKQAGYQVIGLFMKNWEEQDEDGRCTQAEDFEDVATTCAKIGIPYQSVNFVKEYREQVFSQFIKDYQAGHTPNPDILCNREIKFKVFFEKAMSLGADALATGHYCQTDGKRLLKGHDASKDQSYFLSAIDGSTLSRVLFPIGHLDKKQVREIAKEYRLPTHNKKDSTGICFIGEPKGEFTFQSFLAQYVKSQPGDFKTLDGTRVGQHLGACYYTLGQRRHLGLGGAGQPWYVVKKDIANNIVYVERDEHHRELYTQRIHANQESWISGVAPAQFPFVCKAKIRYRQADQDCVVSRQNDGSLVVDFDQEQRAAAPRQSVVFYKDDECLGGAIIR